LVGLADAYLIAAQTDGLVLVAGVGTLKRSVLEQALEELRVSGTPALGMVVNKAKDISQDALDWRYRQASRADSTEARSTQAVESSSYLDGSPRHPD
jgi:Mrp family chromosome partitioning ATPase